MEYYIIYKYIKVDENSVVYVGRTNNLERRRREHEVYNINRGTTHKNTNYTYPLRK